MEEIEALGDVNFGVLCFNPSDLIDNFVTPFVHAFVANVHLGVEDPEEAKAFL